MRKAIDWSAAPVVEIPLVVIRCPSCWAADYTVVRSQGNQGDGSRLRRCLCSACLNPFVVVADPAIKWQGE